MDNRLMKEYTISLNTMDDNLKIPGNSRIHI